MSTKIAAFLVFLAVSPLAVYAQEATSNPSGSQTISSSIQSNLPKLDVNNVIDPQRFMDILKKNIDVPKIESILRKNSDQKTLSREGITADLVISFIKDAGLELLHSIGGLVYGLMHILGLEAYLRYLPRF